MEYTVLIIANCSNGQVLTQEDTGDDIYELKKRTFKKLRDRLQQMRIEDQEVLVNLFVTEETNGEWVDGDSAVFTINDGELIFKEEM